MKIIFAQIILIILINSSIKAAYNPVAIFYGLGSNCLFSQNIVDIITKELGNSTYIKCIEVGDGSISSLSMQFSKQAELACKGCNS